MVLLQTEIAEKDLVWRMPLSEGYMKQINKVDADLSNTGGRAAGACTAAIFLKRFVNGLIVDGNDMADAENIRWAHVDIAGE
jgi:aminopeptidase